MKTLLFFKKIALVGFFFTAFTASSQFTMGVYTQNTSAPGVCDGAAFLDSNIVADYISWVQANTIIQQGGFSVMNLCEGTYTVTYANGQNPPATETFTIGSNTPNPCAGFYAFASGSNSTNALLCDGTASVQANGGTAPFTYLWSNNFSIDSISNLCVGIYTCQIVDANGCMASSTVYISDNSINNVDTTVTIINTTFPLDSILGSIGSQMVEDCNLDITQVGSATITSYTVNGNDVDLTWTLFDLQGNSLATYTVSYPSTIDSAGIYQATFILTCYGKTLNNYELTIVDQFSFNGLVGINENNLGDVKYNNPINEQLSVEFPTVGNYDLTVVDLSGKKVVFGSFVNTSIAMLNTNALKSGSYILTISTNSAQISFKLVK